MKRILHLLTLCLLINCISVWSVTPPIRFQRIVEFEEFLHTSVRAIVQDDIGFIWLGTEHGLYRYDGYDLKRYSRDANSTDTLAHNFVQNLMKARDGTIWISTIDGISCLDPETDVFQTIRHNPSAALSLPSEGVQSSYEDSKGNIWIATGGGLCRYDRTRKTLETFLYDPNDELSISGNHINEICEDKDGYLWIGTNRTGLNRYDYATNTFKRYVRNLDDPTSFPSGAANTVFQDSRGKLWIGTWADGLVWWDKQTDLFHLIPETDSMVVKFINEDHLGNVWAGTLRHGLVRIDGKSGNVSRYVKDQSDQYNLQSNDILSFCEDSSG
ncbi:hypothetical protein K8I31_03825, partial [bacterium]|nr:hypothetical protein [bacterium]